MLHSVNNPI